MEPTVKDACVGGLVGFDVVDSMFGNTVGSKVVGVVVGSAVVGDTGVVRWNLRQWAHL